jgi:hypothetical protein
MSAPRQTRQPAAIPQWLMPFRASTLGGIAIAVGCHPCRPIHASRGLDRPLSEKGAHADRHAYAWHTAREWHLPTGCIIAMPVVMLPLSLLGHRMGQLAHWHTVALSQCAQDGLGKHFLLFSTRTCRVLRAVPVPTAAAGSSP